VADLLGDMLVLAARKGKLVQRMRVAAILQQFDQQARQCPGFVGAGLQQIEELRIVAKVLLDGKHQSRSGNFTKSAVLTNS
jgi:hypothetical protein